MPHFPLRRSLRSARVPGAAVALASLAALPAPATAAESVTRNACFYAIDGFWRALDFRIAATSSPGYVPPGGGFALRQAAIAAAFPDWIAEYGFNLGHLDPGVNRIKAHAWVAINGKGSAQGTQVVKTEVTVETTITAAENGQKFVSATPLAVTVPLPDTVWTAPAADAQSVEFTQGSPGQLPSVPGFGGGPAVQPVGSIFIRAELSSSIAFDLDCLPGNPTADFKRFTTGEAPKFDLAWSDPAAPPTGIAAPPVRSPSATVTSKSLKLKAGKRISVTLANQGLITATGQVRVRTKSSYKLGRRKKARISVLGWTGYELGSGDRSTLKLNVSSQARALLKGRRSVKVLVETRATTGERDGAGKPRYAAPTFAELTLRR